MLLPSEDVQKHILATSEFTKGMQSDINLYVTRDRINNASFREKLDPINKNIVRQQNPLELVFEDISTFDAENPIVGALLREPDVGKKVLASHLMKQAPGPPGQDFAIRNRLNKSTERQELKVTICPLLHHSLHFLLVLEHLYHHCCLLFNLHHQFLIHFNHHHLDLIILLVIFKFLHNFHLLVSTTLKDYLEIYLFANTSTGKSKRKSLG